MPIIYFVIPGREREQANPESSGGLPHPGLDSGFAAFGRAQE
jgi:hypothetical protein